jgi:hypothetical protein
VTEARMRKLRINLLLAVVGVLPLAARSRIPVLNPNLSVDDWRAASYYLPPILGTRAGRKAGWRVQGWARSTWQEVIGSLVMQ